MIELEDSDDEEFSAVEEEKENEEVENEAREFTDEISSEDDEDLDDLVEKEVAIATRALRSGKKTNATLTFGLRF